MASSGLSTTQYAVKDPDPLELKDFSLIFRERKKLLGIPKGHPGPGPNGGEDFAPDCSADIVAVKAGGDEDSDTDMFDEDDERNKIVIGRITAQTIEVGRIINDHMSMWEICDMQSDELSDMFNALYERDGSPKEAHDEELGCNDVLYVHEVYLKKRYRGYGIGLLAVDGLINGLSSFSQGTALLSPNAITREAGTGFDSKTASEKLEKYWELIGFKMWENSDEHGQIMGLWTGHKTPNIEEAVPHLMRKYA